MREILAGELDEILTKHGIIAKKTYEAPTIESIKTQVWEIEEDEFQKLLLVAEKEVENTDKWIAWGGFPERRSCDARFNINHHYLKAWDNEDRDDGWYPRKYENLFNYFDEELRMSKPSSICQLAIDLAESNNMKLSELFSKYQPNEAKEGSNENA